MQREIKFRAWDKISKTMVELIEFKYVGKTHIQLFYHDEDGCSTTCTVLLENIELLQYTGLKDKKGKEIYDGDIVTGLFNHTDIIGHIIYGSDATFFIKRKGLYGIGLNNAEDWLEVIGNIYENQELLKE